MTIDDLSLEQSVDSAQDQSTRMISLDRMRAAIRRRRRFWVATGLVGLLLGLALPVLVPHKYSAVTSLYLVEPQGTDASNAMQVDLSLLQTTAVAQKAVEALGLSETPSSFLSSYRGTVVSNAIMSVKLTAGTKAAATRRAEAVATAFLTLRSAQYAQQADVTSGALNAQITSLQSKVAQLTALINGASGQTSVNQIADLVNSRQTAETQISQLQQQLQQDQLSASLVTSASKVLDPAALLSQGTKKTLVKDGLAGLIGGLGLGLLVVLVGAGITDRLYRRDEIAVTLGAPVRLSVGNYRPVRFMRRYRLGRRLRKPSSELRMIERRLRIHLEQSPGSALATVCVGPAEAGALAVAILARSLISDGARVTVVDLAEGRPLVSLLRRDESAALTEIVGPEDPAQAMPVIRSGEVDATLVLATLDPAFGADHISAWASEAVVVVTAGRASSGQISAAGKMLHQARINTVSAIVVGADPEDESVGVAAVPATNLLERVEASWAAPW